MPRIYASNNDPIDYCKGCFPITEEDAYELFGCAGPGPDGRGNCFSYDAEHPDYRGLGYRCWTCKKLLTSKDNDPKPRKGTKP